MVYYKAVTFKMGAGAYVRLAYGVGCNSPAPGGFLLLQSDRPRGLAQKHGGANGAWGGALWQRPRPKSAEASFTLGTRHSRNAEAVTGQRAYMSLCDHHDNAFLTMICGDDNLRRVLHHVKTVSPSVRSICQATCDSPANDPPPTATANPSPASEANSLQ